MIGTFTKFGIHRFVEYQLGNTVTVTKIDKRHPSHFTCTLYPTCQRYTFACIGKSELSSMTSEHIFFKFNQLFGKGNDMFSIVQNCLQEKSPVAVYQRNFLIWMYRSQPKHFNDILNSPGNSLASFFSQILAFTLEDKAGGYFYFISIGYLPIDFYIDSHNVNPLFKIHVTAVQSIHNGETNLA